MSEVNAQPTVVIIGYVSSQPFTWGKYAHRYFLFLQCRYNWFDQRLSYSVSASQGLVQTGVGGTRISFAGGPFR